MTRSARCPKCGSPDSQRVRFTWWAGLLGPWLLRYLRCERCGCKFSARFGKSAILMALLYNAVLFLTGAALITGAIFLLCHGS